VSTAEDLRAALAVAELEEQFAAAKEAGSDDLADLKDELRYRRWVARGGPQVEAEALAATEEHTNRAAAAHYERWLQEG
jgi:hypothetical protein